ncbi:GNAT family N-acetyltransferase [Kribbella sp. NPDC004875]|uniref:GNAT family N-acetyltransferase n=1 Tax=Kribbella sp. NPDC004875 TaxID=3364107 RepID=UPI0036A519B7
MRLFTSHAGGTATISESQAVLLVAAAGPFPGAFHNASIRLDPTAGPNAVLESVLSFADRRCREMILWASSDYDRDLVRAAARAGLRLRSSTVGMATEKPPDMAVIPKGLEVVRVTNAEEAAQFAAVHEGLFRETGRPVEAVAHFASPGVLLAPNTAAFVARVGGRPVAGAMAVITGAEAGVYWVATRTDARRQGFGESVTRAAVRAAFEHGARVVLLQSTELGVRLYRRLGFAPLTDYQRYLIPQSQPIRDG